jgi:prepilin-type N-terminal cleavage/methylation domain-containing protein
LAVPRPGRPAGAIHRASRGPAAFEKRGFTLIEILIVVVIMAILAGVILPMLTGTTIEAKDAGLLMNLRVIRGQIQLFQAEHNGSVPGSNGGDPVQQLTLYTDLSGNVSATKSTQYFLGPYMQTQGIENPFNSGTAIMVSTNPAGQTPDPYLAQNGVVVGWFYNPQTGEIAANAQGSNAAGVPRISL